MTVRSGIYDTRHDIPMTAVSDINVEDRGLYP